VFELGDAQPHVVGHIEDRGHFWSMTAPNFAMQIKIYLSKCFELNIMKVCELSWMHFGVQKCLSLCKTFSQTKKKVFVRDAFGVQNASREMHSAFKKFPTLQTFHKPKKSFRARCIWRAKRFPTSQHFSQTKKKFCCAMAKKFPTLQNFFTYQKKTVA
jgi:hypothetical protein